ncbi:MAG: hypothetical protein AABM40_05785 [Chloroflexota bacterium]
MPGSGRLIDQFCEAAEAWVRAVGAADAREIAFYVLFWAGGSGRYKPVGAVDQSGLSPAQREKLTFGQTRGHFTIDQVRDRLQRATNVDGFDEEFLVVSLVAAIATKFEEESETYAKGLAKRRAIAERWQAEYDDEATRAALIEEMNTRGRGTKRFSEADFLEMIEYVKASTTPSLRDQRERRRRSDAWREATAALVDPANLEAYSVERLQQFRDSGGFDNPDLDL